MNVPFKIYEGESIRLNDLPIKEGNLVICKDTKQIFADLKVNNIVTRIPLNSNEIDLSNYETIENAARKLQEAKDYTDEKIKDLPTGDSSNAVELITEHNSAENAHEDIRNAIPTKTSDLTNDSNFITSSDVDTKISALVDSAPETLDTLNELAEALGDDPNFATTIANQIGNKVDKIEGKGLSTNDYTTEEKEKLAELMMVNPNLLHNWYFGNPVNQRGQTEYSGAGYAIDRWKFTGASSVLKVVDGGITFTPTATSNGIRQDMEYPEEFVGKTVTVSFLLGDANGVKARAGYGDGSNHFGEWGESGIITATGTVAQDVTTFTAFIQFDAVAESPVIIAAKLELGSTQTIAHQDASGNWVLNEIPDYNEELLKCCMSTADSTDTYANNKKTASILDAIAENAELTTDCNIHLTTGGYKFLVAYYNTATLNSPYADPNCSSDDASGLVLTFTVSPTYGRQICLTGAGDGVFVRYNAGGTISPWAAFATTDYAASKAEHRIPHYIGFADIGLKDADMSSTDLAANLQAIYNAMPAYSELWMISYSGTLYTPNFYASLNEKIKADIGGMSSHTSAYLVYITRQSYYLTVTVGTQNGTLSGYEYSCVYRSGSTSPLSTFSITRDPNGFVSKAGDTMTGNLGVNAANASIILKDTTKDKIGKILEADNTLILQSWNSSDLTNTKERRQLNLRNQTAYSNISDALILYDVNTAGTATPYKIYGEHNKPATLATNRTIDGVSFNGGANVTHYGTCATAAATVEKTVACSYFTLTTGARIVVKFTVTNTAADPTLNVNSTGAKPIYYRGAAITAGNLAANRIYEFVYDGTNYEVVGDIDSNTTYYIPVGTCTTAAATAAKVMSHSYFSLSGSKHFMMMFRYANTAASALTLNIANTGAKSIYINGAASSSTNYTIPAGVYLVYYDGTNYHIRTDGVIPGTAAPTAHNQAASTITAGTFPATDIKAKTGTDYTTARIRNIQASTTDLTAGTSTLASGDIYLVYE